MKKNTFLDFKLFNIACWLTILFAYIIPVREKNDIVNVYGFPFSFFSVYVKNVEGNSLLTSSLFNIGNFIFNVFIIYVLIYLFKKIILIVSNKSKLT